MQRIVRTSAALVPVTVLLVGSASTGGAATRLDLHPKAPTVMSVRDPGLRIPEAGSVTPPHPGRVGATARSAAPSLGSQTIFLPVGSQTVFTGTQTNPPSGPVTITVAHPNASTVTVDAFTPSRDPAACVLGLGGTFNVQVKITPDPVMDGPYDFLVMQTTDASNAQGPPDYVLSPPDGGPQPLSSIGIQATYSDGQCADGGPGSPGRVTYTIPVDVSAPNVSLAFFGTQPFGYDFLPPDNLTVVPLPPVQPTFTAVSCVPVLLPVVGLPWRCTATVTDTAPSPSTPTGTVTLTSSRPGRFAGNPCTLTRTSPGVASCSVTYIPSFFFFFVPHTITAGYSGDLTHTPSSGTTTVDPWLWWLWWL